MSSAVIRISSGPLKQQFACWGWDGEFNHSKQQRVIRSFDSTGKCRWVNKLSRHLQQVNSSHGLFMRISCRLNVKGKPNKQRRLGQDVQHWAKTERLNINSHHFIRADFDPSRLNCEGWESPEAQRYDHNTKVTIWHHCHMLNIAKKIQLSAFFQLQIISTEENLFSFCFIE